MSSPLLTRDTSELETLTYLKGVAVDEVAEYRMAAPAQTRAEFESMVGLSPAVRELTAATAALRAKHDDLLGEVAECWDELDRRVPEPAAGAAAGGSGGGGGGASEAAELREELREELRALERKLEERGPAAGAPQLEQLASRMDALERRAERTEASAAAPASAVRDLERKLQALERRLEERGPAQRGGGGRGGRGGGGELEQTRLEALVRTVADIERRLQQDPPRPAESERRPAPPPLALEPPGRSWGGAGRAGALAASAAEHHPLDTVPRTLQVVRRDMEQLERQMEQRIQQAVSGLSTAKQLEACQLQLDEQRAQSAAEQGKLAEELHEHEGLLGELTGMCTDLREITQEALTTAKRSGARADEVCAAWESVNRSRANVRAQSASASLLAL